MAYESTSTELGDALTNSHSLALTQSVIDQILSIVGSTATIDQFVVSSNTTVTVPAGTEVGFFHTDDSTVNSLHIENPPPVIILQTSAGVEVLVNTGTATNATYVIVGSAGNDNIVITGTSNTDISLGTGNSTVMGGQGSDTIHAGSGNETIDGGGGNNDVLIVHGGSGDWDVSGGSTVTAGTSDLSAQAAGTSHVILTNTTTGQTIDFTGIQYVALDNNDAIVVATSTVEAGVASLYHAAFGRTGEAGGMDFWFDYAKAGLSLHDIATGFTQSAEYAPIAAMSDSDFVTQLYTNTFGRAPDAGGMAYWLQQLSHGASRVDLLTQFASVAAWNEEGVIHTEATVVGTVIIDSHIV